MFSAREKREISDKIQKILRETNHPELPKDEIEFCIHVKGKEDWPWADIKNNGAVLSPDINPYNEMQDQKKERIKYGTLQNWRKEGSFIL